MRVFLSSSLPARIPTIPPDAFFSQNEKKRNNKKKNKPSIITERAWFGFTFVRIVVVFFLFVCLLRQKVQCLPTGAKKQGEKRVLITRDHAPRHGLSSHLYRVQAKENRLCGVWYAFSTTVTYQNRTAVFVVCRGRRRWEESQ